MKSTVIDDASARRMTKLMKERERAIILPPFWRAHPLPVPWARRWAKLTLDGSFAGVVILEPEDHDGATWWHLSVSRTNRLPTWDELVEAKEVFLGVDVAAAQVVPPRSKHVNIMPFCLHLFTRVDGTLPLPDFRHEDGSL